MNRLGLTLFAGWDWGWIGIQAIGFVAMALGILSFQCKKRTSILLFQMSDCVLWSIQFFLLGSITGGVLNIIGIIRNLLYAQRSRWKWTNSPLLPAGIILIFCAAGVLTYEGPSSLLPILAMVISSISLFISDEKMIRRLGLLVSLPWLGYDIIFSSIAGIISELFTITSIVIAMFRYDFHKKDKSENV